MAENGEEKLIAVARHIAKTLGHTDSMTNDILKIFSNFDGRLREKLSDHAPEHTLKSLSRRLSLYISVDAEIWSNSADSSSFLDSVDQLINTIREWTPLADDDKSISSCLDSAQGLLHLSMLRLEDQFKGLIEGGAESTRHSDYSDDEEDFIPVGQPITDCDFVIDVLPATSIGDLHEIAKRMMAAGYSKECTNTYIACRREFLDLSFSRLGLQKLSIDEVQRMQWTQLEDEIEKWIKAINVALRFLIPSERRLCDRVFLGFSSSADPSFLEVCRGSIIQLLNFADAVAISSRAPERLFKVLDIYETTKDLMPEFELILSDEYCLCLRNEAMTVVKRLGKVIRGMFLEFENLIHRDPAKSAVPGGGLHPITRYVMNYLHAASQSRRTLEHVFEEMDVKGDERTTLSSSSSVGVQFVRIMELLESNLEAKSKVYKDAALCSVFMMNNLRYIVQKVKDNELGTLLGDDWIRKHMTKVRQYHVKYQRSSWSKVLGVLKVDRNSLSSNGASKILREKLKLFNTYFEEICKTQSSWVIFDEQLKEELKVSVSGTLSPAYRNFIGRLQAFPDIGKHAAIRYSVEDIEARISELFQGSCSGRRPRPKQVS